MRCAQHGDSVNCPPFCTQQIRGTEDPGTPGGPPAERITDELSRDAVRKPDEHANDSKSRDVDAADRDVAEARKRVAVLAEQIGHAVDALTWAREQLAAADELLRKYEQPAQQPA